MNFAAGFVFLWLKTLCWLPIISIKKYKKLQNCNHFFYNLQSEEGEEGRSEWVLLIVEEFISECIRLN